MPFTSGDERRNNFEFYGVAVGKKAIYTDWDKVYEQTNRVSGNLQQGFEQLLPCAQFMLRSSGLAAEELEVHHRGNYVPLSFFAPDVFSRVSNEIIEDNDTNEENEHNENTYVKHTTDESTEPDMAKVIINPVLTYIAHSIDNSPPEYIKKCCHDFYSSEELFQAKDILWKYGDKSVLPQYFRRRDTAGRSGIDATLSDIIQGVQNLDEAGELPRFAVDAVGLHRIPKATPSETSSVSICERLAKLEARMNSNEDSLSNNMCRVLSIEDKVSKISEQSTSYANMVSKPSVMKTPTPGPEPNVVPQPSRISNNQRKFWDEVRKVSHKKSMTNPNNVDGVQGEMNVGSLFRQKYETLYQSVPYNKEDMKRIICEVDNGVNNVCNNHECTNNHDITVNDIQCAIKKIKLFKSDACFELFSNNLIYGGNSLYVHISLLFNSMLKHGVTPDNMSLSTLIPIPKSFKRSRNDSNNYRAIALGSVFGKVLDHVILNQNINEMSSCDLQFGFKSKHSTTQCTYVLQEIIDMYTRNKASLYIILLDASQAFDRVDYCKLFELLISRNICNCTVRLLINMYTSQSLRVKWGDTITDGFTCQNGVKQGGVISPILFCIYMDVLLLKLSKSGVGCHIGNSFVGSLCYADDVTLIAPSRNAMNILLDICQEYAQEYSVKFNSTKSKLVTYNVSTTSNIRFALNKNPIERVDSALHLGHHIGMNYNKKNIDLAVGNLISRTNILLSRFGTCSCDIRSSLFRSYCTSFYGSPLWNLNNNDIQRFYTVWRKCIRRLWGIPYRTRSKYLATLQKDNPIDIQLLCRYIKFMKCNGSSNNSLVILCNNLQKHGDTPNAVNYRKLMNMINNGGEDKIDNGIMCDTYKANILRTCIVPVDVVVNVKIIEELSLMKNGVLNSELSKSEIDELLQNICCE